MRLAYSRKSNSPAINAYVQHAVPSPDTFNPAIHDDDEMYRLGEEGTGGQAERTTFLYLRAGRQIFRAIEQIVAWRFGSFDKVAAYLAENFAGTPRKPPRHRR